MLTGTPLDLTPFGPLLSVLGWLYWVLALGTAVLMLWLLRSQSWRLRVPLAVAVLAAFIYPVATHVQQKHQQHDQANAKLDEAMGLFQERCKTAGEQVRRTVENVDGLMLTNVRAKEMNYAEQFKMDDPYGRDCGGDDCIASYLFDYRMVPSSADPNAGLKPSKARLYAYVDVVDVATGMRFRYTKESANSPLVRVLAPARPPRYGVNWADVSTRSDREHWIAGGSLKVVDMQTNEVIAERVGYLIDQGQGSTAGFRTPWTWARSNGPNCPSVRDHNQTFVSTVLKPSNRE